MQGCAKIQVQGETAGGERRFILSSGKAKLQSSRARHGKPGIREGLLNSAIIRYRKGGKGSVIKVAVLQGQDVGAAEREQLLQRISGSLQLHPSVASAVAHP